MLNRKISNVQLWAWLFTGLSAPLAMIAAGCGWLQALAASAACAVAGGYVRKKVQNTVRNKWLSVVQIVWIVIVLGLISRWVDESWPAETAYPTVPIVLLILAAMAASGGAEKSARIGCVLFWMIMLIYIGVICTGVADINIKQIQTSASVDDRLVLIVLSTSLAGYMPLQGDRMSWKAAAGIVSFAVLISLLVNGSLSTDVASKLDNPFHEWVRGLSLKGVAQRFEAMVSVALTAGWFAYMAYMLSVIGCMAATVKKDGGKRGVWICAGIVIVSMFSHKWINTESAVAGSLLIWVAVPLIYDAGVKIKFKKIEKSA